MHTSLPFNSKGIFLGDCSDPHGEFKGKNILIRLKDAGLSTDDESELATARKKLHIHRAQRPRPHLDDKVNLEIWQK